MLRTPWRADVRQLRPMLATSGDPPLQHPRLVYEPKYDGIRALIEVVPSQTRTPARRTRRARLQAQASRGVRLQADMTIWSRLGNEKTSQFPEIVRALERWSRTLRAPIILDGEIVALDERGEPAGFQKLQGRIHVTQVREEGPLAPPGRVAFIAFDLLREGDEDLRPLPLRERRARLERVFGRTGTPLLRLSDFAAHDGHELFRDAMARGLEGLIAKHADSRYRDGRRTTDWRKLKIVRRQEFVIGGWTEPRGSRAYFGSLLLGVYEPQSPTSRRSPIPPQSRIPNPQSLMCVGHAGSGFDEAELARLWGLLKKLETTECPFQVRPTTNERPHWVRPTLVAEVKFTEWTDAGMLRHPTYLGLRDDVTPASVRREPVPKRMRGRAEAHGRVKALPDEYDQRTPAAQGFGPAPSVAQGPSTARPGTVAGRALGAGFRAADLESVIAQLQDLEDRRRDGVVQLPGGATLEVGNLHKVFWPDVGITKGELMRYYVRVAPFILPAIEDRPLVMKRFPNGITGKTFYQQRAPDAVPPGVRVEVIPGDAAERGAWGPREARAGGRGPRIERVPSRLIGGSLLTLLYLTQLAAISQDPWFSRAQSPGFADHVAIDLDPAPGVSFAKVLDVARWVHDELETLGAPSVPKTSGARGLHIYIPLAPETPYEAGLIYCQIVATMVARRHPRDATVERLVRARGPKVYVDYLQNIRGKTLATAYSARASDYAGASTPLTWKEVHEGVDRRDFTIRTLPDRLKKVGDLWAALRKSKGADLRKVSRYVES